MFIPINTYQYEINMVPDYPEITSSEKYLLYFLRYPGVFPTECNLCFSHDLWEPEGWGGVNISPLGWEGNPQ